MTHRFPSRDLDDALLKVREPGDTIQLEPGEYTTRGSGASDLAPGVTLDATGSKIKLVDPVLTDRPWIEPPILGHGSKVVGGDWDLGDHGGIAQCGFRAAGTVQIHGATIRGLFGRRKATDDHPTKEAFAFTQDRGTGGTQIINVTAYPLRPDHDDYVAGVYVNDGNAEVSGCDMRLGMHGQFAYSTARSATFAECHGEAARFFYTDTAGFLGVACDCSGRAHWAAFAFAGGGESDGPRHLTAVNCNIDATGGRIVEFDDTVSKQAHAYIAIFGGEYRAHWRIASNSQSSRAFIAPAKIDFVEDHIANGAPFPITI